jgi:serine protease Do
VAGGIGERAGLKPGDQIIAYNGVRVFNQGELLPLMQKFTTSGTSIAVDVVRNGKTIRLNAEGGDLRFVPAASMVSALDMVKRQKLDAAVKGR